MLRILHVVWEIPAKQWHDYDTAQSPGPSGSRQSPQISPCPRPSPVIPSNECVLPHSCSCRMGWRHRQESFFLLLFIFLWGGGGLLRTFMVFLFSLHQQKGAEPNTFRPQDRRELRDGGQSHLFPNLFHQGCLPAQFPSVSQGLSASLQWSCPCSSSSPSYF